MESPSLLSEKLLSDGNSLSGVCCIARDGVDKLRVIGFSGTLLDAFRAALLAFWAKGIQAERVYGCAFQFKLVGAPWKHTDRNTLETCRLVIGIMRFMLSQGWAVELEMTASNQHQGNMDSWFFRKQMQDTQLDMCSMSFKWGDRIRIVDGPEVRDVVESAIKNHWHRGLNENFQQDRSDAMQEFKLKGFPWRSTAKEKMYTNTFVMHLMDALKTAGWTVYTPVDSCSIYKDSEINYWIFQKINPLVDESDSSLS